MIRIERYRSEWATEWNDFVRESKNGTFLFDRDYMDYHSDRFRDHSLIFTDEDCHWLAVLPANEHDGMLHSHQGLTYGGLIMSKDIKVVSVLEMFSQLMLYASANGIQRIIYKSMPWIYHAMPAEEDLYALTQICHATLLRRSISSTITQSNRLPLHKSRKCGLSRARKTGIAVGESTDFAEFWHILCDNLHTRYDAAPVHTLQEMLSLRTHFPENIRLFTATLHEEMLGGVVIYDCGQTVHTQYISASPQGKQLGALDLLIKHLTDEVFADRQYFDFGTSNDDTPFGINESLIYQKQGFGGRGICYDTYQIDVKE